MAWTTPKTWTAALVTVDEFNTHIRDNLNWLKNPTSDVATLASQITTTSTSFTDATGLSVTMTTNGGNVLCLFTGCVNISGAGGTVINIDLALDGTRQGGTDGLLVLQYSGVLTYNATLAYIITGVSAGAHTIKVQWKQNSATGTATMYAENSSANFKVVPTLYCVEMG